jgi:hypothetical protein
LSAFDAARPPFTGNTKHLDSGGWRKRNPDLLDLEALDVGYRLLRWDSEMRLNWNLA